MSRIIKIIVSQFRELSLKEFLRLVLKSVYQSDPLEIYALDIKERRATNATTLEGVIVKKGDIAELEKFRQKFDPIPWELKCNEYDGVDDFFIVHSGDSLQHINWIYYSQHHNRILAMSPKEAEFKFGLTFPPYRGRGLQPRALEAMTEYLADKSFQRVFACVASGNKPSIRGIEKAGFKKVGRTRLRKIFGVQISKKINTSEIQICYENNRNRLGSKGNLG